VEDAHGGGGSPLAAIGAAARRASEDSSSVAYIGTPNRIATDFSTPILDEAGIARIAGRSGVVAMKRLLRSIRHSDDAASLREAVYEHLS
jgi:hypothetical protein